MGIYKLAEMRVDGGEGGGFQKPPLEKLIPASISPPLQPLSKERGGICVEILSLLNNVRGEWTRRQFTTSRLSVQPPEPFLEMAMNSCLMTYFIVGRGCRKNNGRKRGGTMEQPNRRGMTTG